MSSKVLLIQNLVIGIIQGNPANWDSNISNIVLLLQFKKTVEAKHGYRVAEKSLFFLAFSWKTRARGTSEISIEISETWKSASDFWCLHKHIAFQTFTDIRIALTLGSVWPDSCGTAAKVIFLFSVSYLPKYPFSSLTVNFEQNVQICFLQKSFLLLFVD